MSINELLESADRIGVMKLGLLDSTLQSNVKLVPLTRIINSRKNAAVCVCNCALVSVVRRQDIYANDFFYCVCGNPLNMEDCLHVIMVHCSSAIYTNVSLFSYISESETRAEGNFPFAL